MTTVISTGAALKSTLLRWQFWLLLVVVGLLGALIVQFFDTTDTERYGLQNTELDGYGALAQVLQDHGVEIHRSYSAEAAREHLEEHPEATVAVGSFYHPPEEDMIQQLGELDNDVVWLAPDEQVLTQLGDDQARLTGIPDDPEALTETPPRLEAGENCEDEAALTAESLHTTGEAITTELGEGCFPLAEDASGTNVLVNTEYGTLFGAPDAFTNRMIEQEGHAALALWLLGQNEELIWYTPSGVETADSEDWASPADFLPAWVTPLTWWLLACAVILILVMGRRHGPVISEPLPVHVPASESAEGRGRMYQNANATTASARALRSATMTRLAKHLRLGTLPEETTIIEAAARHMDMPPRDVAQLFEARAVDSNSELVRFGQQLAAFEDDLLQRLGHPPRSAGGSQNHREGDNA